MILIFFPSHSTERVVSFSFNTSVHHEFQHWGALLVFSWPCVSVDDFLRCFPLVCSRLLRLIFIKYKSQPKANKQQSFSLVMSRKSVALFFFLALRSDSLKKITTECPCQWHSGFFHSEESLLNICSQNYRDEHFLKNNYRYEIWIFSLTQVEFVQLIHWSVQWIRFFTLLDLVLVLDFAWDLIISVVLVLSCSCAHHHSDFTFGFNSCSHSCCTPSSPLLQFWFEIWCWFRSAFFFLL